MHGSTDIRVNINGKTFATPFGADFAHRGSQLRRMWVAHEVRARASPSITAAKRERVFEDPTSDNADVPSSFRMLVCS